MIDAQYLGGTTKLAAPFWGMAKTKTSKRPKPYAEHGARLRKRRKELLAQGLFGNKLGTLAAEAGVSVSAFQQWERGETWPQARNKPAVAKAMRWTVEELDYGPAQSQPTKASGSGDELSSHPVSPDEMEMLALYRGLEDQKSDARERLKGMLHARHASQQHMRGPLRPVTDSEVEKKAPITTALQDKAKMPAPKKRTVDD